MKDDLLSGFSNIGRDLIEYERVLLERSDLVVCSSQWLFDEIRSRDPELAAFYASLVESEGNHYATYLLMARGLKSVSSPNFKSKKPRWYCETRRRK